MPNFKHVMNSMHFMIYLNIKQSNFLYYICSKICCQAAYRNYFRLTNKSIYIMVGTIDKLFWFLNNIIPQSKNGNTI